MKKHQQKSRPILNQLKKLPNQRQLLAAGVVLAMLMSLVSPFLGTANAGTLTSTYLRLDRMKVSTQTTMRLVFTNVTAGGNKVTIDMNGIDTGAAQWTNATPGGLVSATQAVDVSTCPGQTGAAALPGTLSASGSGSVITITETVSTMAASTAYCVDLTTANSVQTPSVAGEYHPTISTLTGATPNDSTNIAVRVITNDVVTVNAVVPPTFNFVLNTTTDSFVANLNTSTATATTGVTATMTTNAANGWIVWAKDLNSSGGKGALNSVAAGNNKITSPSAIGSASHAYSGSGDDYGLSSTVTTDAAGGGVVSLDAAYTSAASSFGVLDPAILRPIASASGTANGDVITVKEHAAVAGQTKAASDYTDQVTLIGAGRF